MAFHLVQGSRVSQLNTELSNTARQAIQLASNSPWFWGSGPHACVSSTLSIEHLLNSCLTCVSHSAVHSTQYIFITLVQDLAHILNTVEMENKINGLLNR